MPTSTRRQFIASTARLSAGTIAGAEHLLGHVGETAVTATFQLGAYTRPWDKWEYPVALDAIAEAGFKHAGLMTAKGKTWLIITHETPPEQAARIGEEVRQRGLKLLSLYAGEFPVSQSPEAGLAGLKRLIDNAVACGAPNLMLAGTADEKLYAAYFKTVAEGCPYAAAKGIGLSIKPHGGLNATGPQIRKAIETVGHKNFRLWYDPGNIFYYSDGRLDPVDDAASVDGLVAGMSVKDFLPPKDVMVTPGTGKVDFARVLARLRQGGFTSGPLLVECLKAGDLAQVTAQARQARKFLEDLVAQAKGDAVG
jgi:sugar phosphate isomerase/epimerase